ncbi:Gfo/Idh/MocA family oxidoreductase [Carboxylicivirga caseinilyticus]|uniref:Gfo/Idh/MocA family oxidoreductase n=1 Tax=Carboxylicivirga caseinilyticus TaxID=3417572 RepID=UPI003D32DF4F|nr:Gfo/Idh/MocA family oxidoreductase [Marinilabiliaceae bacterium A049]
MKIIKTGVASYGMSGRIFHGPSLKVLSDQYEVIGVFERTKNESEKLFPQATIYRSFADLLANPEIELVIVNTPDHLHYGMTKEALLAGKHVVTEKPFTLSVEEADELIDLAKKQNRVLSVYQNRRYDGNFKTVKKIIDQGLLGRLVELEIHYDRYRKEIREGSWKEEGDERVGVLFNLGSHLIDQVVQLVGMPTSVNAKMAKVRDQSEVNDYMNIRLDYENLQVVLRSSYLVKVPGPMYSLHGVDGSFIKYGGDPQEELLDKGYLPTGDDWGKEDESNWGLLVTDYNGLNYSGKIETEAGYYPGFYNDLYQCIALEGNNPVPPEQALETVRILNAAVESHASGRTIQL